MVQKRPFDAEEMLEVSFKHPKQVGPSNQLVSFSESVFPENSSEMPKTSEYGCRQVSTEGDEKRASDIFVELPRGAEYIETSFPGSISVSSWATSSTSDDVRSDMPVHFSFYPEYFSPERPIRTLARYEDIYSILLEHPPRKFVPIGANHQADVPEWDLPGSTIRPDGSSGSSFAVGDKSEERLMGTCVVPMPNMESSTYDSEEVGKGRTDCSCEDRRSMRCVRQHIVEAREGLIKTIGLEGFTNLGLCDMGEQVAEKWSAEDEQFFHEIVFNNPASLGKNFWNNFPFAFPSRTKKEIVSYYFNVFMLRKRAEQNRNDHLNADSDNDEWQGSDDNEIITREEDEDSVAESPLYPNDTGLSNSHEHDLHEYEYAQDETCDVNVGMNFPKRDTNDDSEYDHVEIPESITTPLHFQPHDRIVWKERCDDEVQDDSCTTSSDTGVTSQENKKIENGDHYSCNLNGVSNGCSQGYVTEPCDAKAWDSGFVSCSKNKIDFLPTCNMIEEVFGDGLRHEIRRA
ncbi:AT-rich interactive domain-containing protein 2 [Senna tora]|uniref:AT-rich interactive domain-containing protein 2 n=1 Tax=Senna tora TaxID=362788 RepID=A0A835CD32_9FABA|nr:AT-rich interactive domain-containing protein 2 [Senna tora]